MAASIQKCFNLLKKYSYSEKTLEIVTRHGLFVLKKSIEIIAEKELYNKADLKLIISGCLLHDIGSFEYFAGKIKRENYILHGIIGGKILREEGLEKEALIAERHVGSGLSKKYIIKNSLPLPKKNFLPITLEEKIICYADKFHSKSGKKDTIKNIIKEFEKYGREPLKRFLDLRKEFEQ